MTSDNGIHVVKPPFFDRNNYDYWKTRMTLHLKAMSRKIWTIVNDGVIILDDKNLTPRDEENKLLNDQAMNVLYSALHVSEFNRVKNLKTANEIWKKLMEIHEDTSTVKEAKMYVLKGQFNEFAMKKDESVPEMFSRLNDIVNELKGLGFEVPDVDLSHKFLRFLPERYDIIVTLLVRSNLKATLLPLKFWEKYSLMTCSRSHKMKFMVHPMIRRKRVWLSRHKVQMKIVIMIAMVMSWMKRWLSL
jgi:hypothetical protein